MKTARLGDTTRERGWVVGGRRKERSREREERPGARIPLVRVDDGVSRISAEVVVGYIPGDTGAVGGRVPRKQTRRGINDGKEKKLMNGGQRAKRMDKGAANAKLNYFNFTGPVVGTRSMAVS